MIDERALREAALAQACEQMGWEIELGRRVLATFARCVREIRERREHEQELLKQADKRRSRKAAAKAAGGR